MFPKKTVKDYDVAGKRILLTVDFNVPTDGAGTVLDDYRIRMALPTIQYLLEQGAKVFITSHLGRPANSAYDASLSLKPITPILQGLLGAQVAFVPDCIGEAAKETESNQPDCRVFLLENNRFHAGEDAKDPAFAQALIAATSAELWVMDGFGVAHNDHASTAGIGAFLPGVSGLLIEAEYNAIHGVLEQPDRPLLCVIGGAKVSDKIDIIRKFIEVADAVAVVGAMANTFLMASGIAVGKSLVESEALPVAKELLGLAADKARSSRFNFMMPGDVVVSTTIDGSAPTRIVDVSHHTWSDIISYPKRPAQTAYEIGAEEAIFDIGPVSAAAIAGAARLAHTVIWNGTAGVTETKGLAGAAAPFAHGTTMMVEGMIGAHSTDKDHPYTIVGGGDTIGYVESVPGLKDRFAHVSTGGGASLALLSGKPLPGIEALLDK
jgi:phosphoglycerate kinase